MLLIMRGFIKSYLSKGPKYRELKQIFFEEAREEIQTGIDQFIETISNDKGIHKNHFSEWKSHAMSSGNKNVCSLNNKISCRSAKSIFSEHEVKNTMFSHKEDFWIVPIDKAANNVAIISKHFYSLTIIKELNLYCNLSCRCYDNNNYTFINYKTKDQIIKEHKLYLSKHKINLADNMQNLPAMLWIPKMHKNPISFRFIIVTPVLSIKPLSKNITSIFKLFCEKVERYRIKGKIWLGIKAFWTIQNSYPLISSINKQDKSKAAKSMLTFVLSTLYTKIAHDKLLYVLNELTDFAFKGGRRDYMLLFIIQEHFSHGPKVKLEDLTLSKKHNLVWIF